MLYWGYGRWTPCALLKAGQAEPELGSVSEIVASLLKKRPRAAVTTASELGSR